MRAWKNNYPRMPKASWLEAVRVPRFGWGLLLIFIVLGGIYTGAFTPTEAAAMSAVYAFVVAVFVDIAMRPTDAEGVARLGQYERDDPLHHHQRGAVLVPDDQRTDSPGDDGVDQGQGIGWVEFLLVVNVLLLLAEGNVMEPSSIVLITAPILFPVAVSLGIAHSPWHPDDGEHGERLCHPPVGLNLCVASGIARMGITELTIATWPWLVTMLVFLAMVTYIPEMSLWLRLLGMM